MLKSKVKEFLDITGMSQSKFSIDAGVHNTSFNAWLNSDYVLSSQNYDRIEICLDKEKERLKEYLIKE